MPYTFPSQPTMGETFFPPSLNPQHRAEWLDSAVDPCLIAGNVRTLVGSTPYEYLLYGLPEAERRNDGRLRDKWLYRYRHLEEGGWWVSGLDPHNDWQPMDWGRFKPDVPLTDWEKGKPIKYESPPKVPNRVTYFHVPIPIWEKVAHEQRKKEKGKRKKSEDFGSQAGEYSAGAVQTAENPHQNAEMALWLEIQVIFLLALLDFCGLDGVNLPNELNFWVWLQQHPEIPIILTEGEKKAGCLLSQGYVAIGLPGIWNGRVGKKDFNETLHPDLLPMAQGGRKFIILFDYETNPKTQKAVYQATCRTAEAIEAAGCTCQIALLPGPEKGVDDFVMAQGEEAPQLLAAILEDALSLKQYRDRWRWRRQRALSGKYPPHVTLNVRYLSLKSSGFRVQSSEFSSSSGFRVQSSELGENSDSAGAESIPNSELKPVQLPESGLVGLKSAMGTGKTEFMRQWREQHPDARFLNNGHRVNLLKNLAERLNTEIYSEIRSGSLARAHALSITVDSLHKLETEANTYDCVFIDEACQYLAHLLHSQTCTEHRAAILEVLEYIIGTAKLVVLADAHLDDVTVDFFRAMRPADEQPYIIHNTYQNGDRTVYVYEGDDSSVLVSKIFAALMLGLKIIVVSDSKRFIKKVEKMLRGSGEFSVQRSELEEEETGQKEKVKGKKEKGKRGKKSHRELRIWSIHAENSGSEQNIAFIKDITAQVKNVDALLASPSLSTGVDIAEYHFDLVFGVFHAVSQSATECAQALHRYRPKVPIHLWVAPRPPFGYKETNAEKIKERMLQSNEVTAFLIRIDKETGRRGAERDWALDAYCQIEAQRNQSINNLRADLRQLLEEMGHQIVFMGSDRDESTARHLAEAAQSLDAEQIAAIAQAQNISEKEYLSRQSKDYLKPEEFYECEKFRISRAYGLPVTEALVAQDKGGHLLKQFAALEATLSPSEGTIADPTTGKIYPAPPKIVAQRDRQERERLPLCFDWRNYSAQWLARHVLGLPDILRRLVEGEEVTATDPDLVRMRDIALQCRAHIKAILGFTVPVNCSPIWLLGILVDQLGLKLVSRKQGPRGHQVCIYRLKEEELTFALTVLAYRLTQRQERARKVEQEREERQRYAATRQAAYGSSPPQSGVSTPSEKGEFYTSEGGDDTGQERKKEKGKGKKEGDSQSPSWDAPPHSESSTENSDSPPHSEPTTENSDPPPHSEPRTENSELLYVSWLREQLTERLCQGQVMEWRGAWRDLQETVLTRAQMLLWGFP